MKQQVLMIGGGNTFASYTDFWKYLEDRPMSVERMKPRANWKNTFQEKLGDDFEVLTVPMPNRDNADYSEWSVTFQKVLEVVDDNPILIGHSLGGLFLSKYLNLFMDKPIKATILLAAPFNDESKESLGGWGFNDEDEVVWDFSMIAKQAGELWLVHSEDDPIVPFGELAKWKAKLPDAKIYDVGQSYGHFNTPEFPELVHLVRRIVQ